jgi:ribonuclease P protein component
LLHKRFFAFSCVVIPEQKITRQTAFAVVVPKTIAKKAVSRNTLRRRVYSALRELSLLWPKKPMFCILFFKKGSHKISYDLLVHELRDTLIELRK